MMKQNNNSYLDHFMLSLNKKAELFASSHVAYKKETSTQILEINEKNKKIVFSKVNSNTNSKKMANLK